jgi:hypothetical protein
MTEQEWLTSDDFPAMLIFLRGELTTEEREAKTGLSSKAGYLVHGPAQRTTPGRLRAFARTCAPRWRELPLDERSLEVISAYQAFLDETGTYQAFWDAALSLQNRPPDAPPTSLHSLCAVWDDTPYGVGSMTWSLESHLAGYVAREEIAELEKGATEDDRFAWGFFGYWDIPLWRETVQAFNRSLPQLLRETVGNPFRPVVFAPDWRTDTAVALAGQMYESRDFSAMPILADALQDAGCDSADILNHCRGGGPHVRGCWVVDLVLGKS